MRPLSPDRHLERCQERQSTSWNDPDGQRGSASFGEVG